MTDHSKPWRFWLFCFLQIGHTRQCGIALACATICPLYYCVFFFFLQDDGILVIPTVADSPLKLNTKKGLSAEFHDRIFALSSIASISGCCQVALYLLLQFLSLCCSFCSLVEFLYLFCILLQVSIPLGKHNDCPISVSFITFHGADKFLLDTVLDMYSSLQEQASIASNSVHLPDTNGNMDASELLKEKVCSPLSILS